MTTILPAPDVPTLSNTVLTIDDAVLGVNLDGVKWRYTRLSETVGVETHFTPRPNTHGAFDGPVYRRERLITIDGLVVAPTRALAAAAEQQLAAVIADGRTGDYVAYDPDLGPRQATVRLSAPPQLDGAAKGVGVIRFMLQFTAPDWRKYGTEQAPSTALPGGGGGLVWPIGSVFDFGAPGSTGTVTLTNDGTAPTEPEVTINGPLTAGFQVTRVDNGRRLRYETPVADAVVVNCATGTAASGGQDRTGLLTVDEFFTIAPGETATLQFSTLGSETATDPATMTARFAPAYA